MIILSGVAYFLFRDYDGLFFSSTLYSGCLCRYDLTNGQYTIIFKPSAFAYSSTVLASNPAIPLPSNFSGTKVCINARSLLYHRYSRNAFSPSSSVSKRKFCRLLVTVKLSMLIFWLMRMFSLIIPDSVQEYYCKSWSATLNPTCKAKLDNLVLFFTG